MTIPPIHDTFSLKKKKSHHFQKYFYPKTKFDATPKKHHQRQAEMQQNVTQCTTTCILTKTTNMA